MNSMTYLINEINSSVADNTEKSKETIDLITPELVKAAIKKLKSDKSDVSGSFTSDCLKSAPAIFHEQLAVVFRAFLYHGCVSHDLQCVH